VLGGLVAKINAGAVDVNFDRTVNLNALNVADNSDYTLSFSSGLSYTVRTDGNATRAELADLFAAALTAGKVYTATSSGSTRTFAVVPAHQRSSSLRPRTPIRAA